MREALTTSVALAILAADLCAAETPEPVSSVPTPRRDVSVSQPLSASCVDGIQGPEAVRDLNRELGVYLRRLREDEELLGHRRRRELRTARYNVARDDDATFSLIEDDPLAFEETTDILRSCFVKLARERLERHLSFDKLQDRFADRVDSGDAEDGGRRGWRISPRIGLSRDPHLGANLKLRQDAGDFWSHITLGLRQRLASGEGSVFLQYEDRDGDRFFRLEQVFDDEVSGDQVLLSVRMRL